MLPTRVNTSGTLASHSSSEILHYNGFTAERKWQQEMEVLE